MKRNSGVLPDISRNQSNLVHIPLGRLLFNINKDIALNLIELFNKSNNKNNFSTINEIKLIHEEQWYMVKRNN